MSRFKIGDRAWNGIYGDYAEEVIIILDELKSESGDLYYAIRDVEDVDSEFPSFVFASRLFRTEEEAIVENKRRKKEALEKACDSIHDVSYLVKMMYIGLYSNKNANQGRIEIAKRKAKELLGVEL